MEADALEEVLQLLLFELLDFIALLVEFVLEVGDAFLNVLLRATLRKREVYVERDLTQ